MTLFSLDSLIFSLCNVQIAYEWFKILKFSEIFYFSHLFRFYSKLYCLYTTRCIVCRTLCATNLGHQTCISKREKKNQIIRICTAHTAMVIRNTLTNKQNRIHQNVYKKKKLKNHNSTIFCCCLIFYTHSHTIKKQQTNKTKNWRKKKESLLLLQSKCFMIQKKQ